MKSRRMYGDLPTLPPLEYRTSADIKKSSQVTPLDERGFVDLDGLVELAKSYVEPEYSWSSPYNDIHHLQWSLSTTTPKSFTDTEKETLADFRELVNRRMYVPRVFHNWVHWLTTPPPVPEVEAMQYSIDAQRVAMSLARTARLATKLSRIPKIPEKRLNQRLDEEFINYNLYFDNARLVPEEFQLIKLEEMQVEKVEDLFVVNKELGRLAIGTVPVRLRDVRLAA